MTTPIRRRQYKTPPFETMSESGAHLLRTKIERAWLDRGVFVRVWVERMAWTRDSGGGWVVRSDLVRGRPQNEPTGQPLTAIPATKATTPPTTPTKAASEPHSPKTAKPA